MYRIFYYNGQRVLSNIKPEELKEAIAQKKGMVWVDLDNPTDDEIQLILARIFGFHPLTIEDCLQFVGHPKIDEYKNYLFGIMHQINYYPNQMRISTWEMKFYLGKFFLVTFHIKPIRPIQNLKARPNKYFHLFKKGPDALLHFIIDEIIDNYFPIFEKLEDKIEEIEDIIFEKSELIPQKEILSEIFSFRKIILTLRKIILPQYAIISDLSKKRTKFISQPYRIYFSDILDNITKIRSMIDVYLDLLKGALDSYLSITSQKMNEIMKTLTVIATIMMPLTFIAGIYGMNFKYMPEIHSAFGQKYGYYVVLTFMALIAGFMIYYFKKKRWM